MECIGDTEHSGRHTFFFVFVLVCLSGILEPFRLEGSISLRSRRFGFVSIKLVNDAECKDSDQKFWYHRSERRHLPNLPLRTRKRKKQESQVGEEQNEKGEAAL